MFGMQPEFTKFIGLKSSTGVEYNNYMIGYTRGLKQANQKVDAIAESARGAGSTDGYLGNKKYATTVKYTIEDSTETNPNKRKTFTIELDISKLNLKMEGIKIENLKEAEGSETFNNAKETAKKIKDAYEEGFSKGRSDRFVSRPIGGTRRRQPRSLKRKTA